MKTKFSNQELVHIWAAGRQDHGESSGMSFSPYPLESDLREKGWTASRLYSYSTIIGAIFTRKDGKKLAILNLNSYSMTTSSKHQSPMQGAVRHLDRAYIPCYIGRGDSYFPVDSKTLFKRMVEGAHRRAADFIVSSKKRRTESTRDRDLAQANDICDNLAKIAAFFGHKYKRPDNFDSITAAVEKEARKQDRMRKQAAKQRIIDQQERMQKWLAGDRTVFASFEETKLRVIDDVIETSRGAKVPKDQAVKCWTMLKRWHDAGQVVRASDLPKPLQFGSYTFTAYQPDNGGVLVVGCHDIPFSELARIAVTVGAEA
jgi:hypothetical protein